MDKCFHVLGFLGLTFCMFRALQWPRWFTVLLMLVLGLSIEVVQGLWLVQRTFSVDDLVADAAGVAAALVIDIIWRRFIAVKTQSSS